MSEAQRLEYRQKVPVKIVKVSPVPGGAARGLTRVVGDVTNLGDRELGVVQLRVSFLGRDGRSVHDDTWFPVLLEGLQRPANSPLKPNETRRFDVDFIVPVEFAGKVDVTVVAVQPPSVTQMIR